MPLTNRQKTFAKLIVEGTNSNSECARQAGYSEGQARKTASLLLNGRDFPLVVEHIKELRENYERKYGVSLMGQMKRFADLSRGAEESGQFSAAVNAEKIRSALGGLAIDRRETNVTHNEHGLNVGDKITIEGSVDVKASQVTASNMNVTTSIDRIISKDSYIISPTIDATPETSTSLGNNPFSISNAS